MQNTTTITQRLHVFCKAPNKARYELLGTVTGVAPDTDFVSAAESARADIREKASRMGATVVRIDEVRDVAQLVGVTYGAALALQLGLLAAGAVALTRPGAVAFFADAAAARRNRE